MTNSRLPLRFKQTDLSRAVRAAVGCGLNVVRTEIGPDGSIILDHGREPVSVPMNELDSWRVHKNARAA